MNIYIINGYPKSGKSLFVKMCQYFSNGRVEELSTIDRIKEIASTSFGWNGEKTPKARKFLSDLKDAATEFGNLPFRWIGEKIKEFEDDNNVIGIFIHCREPQEIQKIKDYYGAKTILINRDSVKEEVQSNHADSDIENYNYDIIIYNNNDRADLEDTVLTFLRKENLLPIYNRGKIKSEKIKELK